MDGVKPKKPEAKHHKNKINIPRPTTEGHILTGEINPELERNIPSANPPKLNLNLNAKSFMPKTLQNKQNQNFNNYSNQYPPMNMGFYHSINNQQMNQGYMPNYNNIPAYPMTNPGNSYIPQQMNYSQGYNYSMNQARAMYQNNFQQNNYQNNNFQGNNNNKNKEINYPQKKTEQQKRIYHCGDAGGNHYPSYGLIHRGIGNSCGQGCL